MKLQSSPCGPIPHNNGESFDAPPTLERSGSERQEERLHPLLSEKGRGLERDVELPLAKGRRRDSKKYTFLFKSFFKAFPPSYTTPP